MNPKMQELLDKRAEIDVQIDALGLELLAANTGSLDERWATWKAVANAGALQRSSWVCHSIDKYNMSWYDDFHKDRHQDVDYVDIADYIEECWGDDYGPSLTQEEYDEWREWVIKNNKVGFTYDW